MIESGAARAPDGARHDILPRVTFTAEERAWIERDDALRRRAQELAVKLGRDADDLYRALRQLRRTPTERLALGLRHGRLHPDKRRAPAPR